MTNSSRLSFFYLGMFALPPSLAAIFEVVRANLRRYPVGDWALLEIGVSEAAKGRLLLGPYSRFGWHHPGPLLEYVLLPGYWLSGRSTASLHVSAALLSLLTLLALLGIWEKVATVAQFRSFIVLLAAECVSFALGWDRSAHAETWNPMVAFLPFTGVLLSSVAVVSGAAWVLPLTLFLHALASQSHIEYALPATAAVAIAVGTLLARRRGGGDRVSRRGWAMTALVVLVSWSPTLWEAASRGGGGNLGRIARFFLEDAGGVASRESARWGTALLVFCSPLPKVLGALGMPRPAQLLLSGACAFGLAVSIAVGHVLVRRDRVTDPLCPALLSATEAQLLIAVLLVWRLPGPPYWYVLLWLNAVFFLACLTVATLALGRFPKFDTVMSSKQGGATTALLVALACVPQVRRILAYRPDPVPRESIRVASNALLRLEEPAGAPAPFIELLGPNAWGLGAGVALQLLERGLVPILRSSERDRFGDAFAYTDDPRSAARLPTVYVAAGQRRRGHSVAPLARGLVSVDVVLDLGKAWARPFLESGWGEEEHPESRRVTWATAESAQIRVGLFPRQDYRLHLAAEPGSMPGGARGMDVLVNGVSLGHIELLPAMNEYELPVPSALVRASTTLEFRFDVERLPAQQNPRPLLAAFDFLSFEATLPEGPSR